MSGNIFILSSDWLKAWLHMELFIDNILFQILNNHLPSFGIAIGKLYARCQSDQDPSWETHFSKKSRSFSLFLTFGHVVLSFLNPYAECLMGSFILGTHIIHLPEKGFSETPLSWMLDFISLTSDLLSILYHFFNYYIFNFKEFFLTPWLLNIKLFWLEEYIFSFLSENINYNFMMCSSIHCMESVFTEFLFVFTSFMVTFLPRFLVVLHCSFIQWKFKN